ncbi:hypothetical protein ACHAXS_013812 [Conticribra weissflogii]
MTNRWQCNFRGCSKMILSLLLVASTLKIFGTACKIHGTDSGVCTNKYLPSTYSLDKNDEKDLNAIQKAKDIWNAEIPFCGRWIASYYSPCVPSRPTSEWMAVDANFPFGRLSSDDNVDVYSVRNKDSWVEEMVTSTVEARIEMEKQKGKRHYRFYKNKDCQEAYSRYFCWLNFPRCDEFQESLPMCQSTCENMFRVCGFESDLWRCEENIIDGEYDKEEAEYDDDLGFFPGQPFQKNEFLPKSNGDPKFVCTPSIKGSASMFKRKFVLAWTVLIASVNAFTWM